jgi:hypothetical protein
MKPHPVVPCLATIPGLLAADNVYFPKCKNGKSSVPNTLIYILHANKENLKTVFSKYPSIQPMQLIFSVPKIRLICPIIKAPQVYDGKFFNIANTFAALIYSTFYMYGAYCSKHTKKRY